VPAPPPADPPPAGPGSRGLAVFDIDGVVADVRHRLHYIENGRRAWDAFFDNAGDDPLLPEGAALVADLAAQHDIVWLTGRPEWLRSVTTRWLRDHGLPTDELHLRPAGDYRPAPRYKLGVLRRLAPRGVAAFVDDDDLVVRTAQDAGFPAVLADWVPRGRALRRAQDSDGRT
jgi:phosphoglycolate phosphatase-like HAD superfamily hydrolase